MEKRQVLQTQMSQDPLSKPAFEDNKYVLKNWGGNDNASLIVKNLS